MIAVRSRGTSRSTLHLLFLLAVTQISIVAYSARLSHDMFRTVLSSSSSSKKENAQLDMVPFPMDPPRSAPILSTLQSRAGLFRRRLLVEESVRPANQTTSDLLVMAPLRRLFRGGASASKGSFALASSWHTLLVDLFCKFANFVGQTKTRCFFLLVFSVFVESYATTLSKQAKDTGNALLFGRACLVYLVCMVGFNVSLAKLDVSVAYAVWSALGTTLVTAVGFLFFGETLDLRKLLYLTMIVCGVVGLNLRSPTVPH